MKHGGDLLTYKDSYQGELVDFSSNINPLGTPPGLKKIIMENFDSVLTYPDIEYRELRTSIGQYLGCGPENLLVGNGAMEIIDLFNLAAKRVISLSPAFSEYSLRAAVHQKPYLELNYRQDFTIDLEELNRTLDEDDLLILGNPNNPTGLRIEEDQLLRIYDLVVKKKAYLVLDEAFFEFVPQDYDSIDLFRQYDYRQVGIIRAATKFFGLPGLRLGYGCVSEEVRKRLESKALTWSVNCFADLAGRHIFKDQAYIDKSKAYIAKERAYLLDGLEKIQGIEAYKSLTNFILIKLLDRDEEGVFRDFLDQGIMVRKCSSFKSLGQNHIRIAIKDRANNEKILKAFREIKF